MAVDQVLRRPDENMNLDKDRKVISTSKGVINTKHERIMKLRQSDDAKSDDAKSESNVNSSSYSSNSAKEQLGLEYVANFCRQFHDLFPDHKPLFICPPNEHHVPKFVCSTIRPTLLPYRDLYDAESCAAFVANAIEYEPLVDPTLPPAFLPAPDTVLGWQSGDCFDLATLLVSFLIGAGYDAMIVHGHAPKWICLLDQSQTACPEEEGGAPPGNVNNGGAPLELPDHAEAKTSSPFESQYVKQLEAEARALALAAKDVPDFDAIDELDEDPQEEDDILGGSRVHAWVLIKAGKRGVNESFYIEPTTARRYTTADAPYLSIEAVWNDKNYYVNMQTTLSQLSDCRFDLSQSQDWEYVFIVKGSSASSPESSLNEAKNSTTATSSSSESDTTGMLEGKIDPPNMSSLDQDQQHPEQEVGQVLDVPPTWVRALVLPHELYQRRYTTIGEATTLFRKAKVEHFAEHLHPRGLVKRVTKYENLDRTIPREITESYMNRADRLIQRIRKPLEGHMIEHFGPGRVPDALSCRIDWFGRKREWHFHVGARVDGLVKRVEVFQQKHMETFHERDDLLVYRSVSVSRESSKLDDSGSNHQSKKKGSLAHSSYTLPNGTQNDLVIHKMTEKFLPSSSLLHTRAPRKRTYLIDEGTIRVDYHYESSAITAPQRLYYKNISDASKVEVVTVDPHATRPKEIILDDEFHRVLQNEKECYSAVRESSAEMDELIRFRHKEETSIHLEKNIFDAAKENATEEKHNEQNKEKDDQEMDTRQSDYLTPFLPPSYSSSSSLTKEEASRARESCLKSLKERLLERANIIQSRLDEENAELAKRQAAFQRSQHDQEKGADDEFEQFCNEAMFRISILEQRLTRHEESALQKYADLDQKLHHDTRLSSLHR